MSVWTHGGEAFALVAVSVTTWWFASRAIYTPLPHPPTAGLASIIALNIGVAMVIPLLRRRIHLDASAASAVPDPLYAIYLATLILVSARAAVTLAIITPFAAVAPQAIWSLIPHRGQRWPSMGQTLHSLRWLLRRATVGAVITLLAALIYAGVTNYLRSFHLTWLHARIPAAVAAAALILLCLCVLRLRQQMSEVRQAGATLGDGAIWLSRAKLWSLCRVYLESPMFRYQALLLSVCPMLPLVEAIDDVEAELAWVLFLAPLCAVYYLALLSVSLQQRTGELQLSIEELGASRLREAELQDYAALITQAQEDERRRLARELHDDTAQALVALARGLDSLDSHNMPSGRRAITSPPTRDAPTEHSHDSVALAPAENDARFIAELGVMARQALENVRRACRDLRPSVLDDLGLAAALDALSADMSRRGLPCVFHVTGDERAYPSTVEVAIYRIAQEALTNAFRHAQPTQSRLDLAYEADHVRLVVADNGRGFDYTAQLRRARLARQGSAIGDDDPLATTEHATAGAMDRPTETRAGLGLVGMRERAALIGARLDIQSRRGIGTRLMLVARADGDADTAGSE